MLKKSDIERLLKQPEGQFLERKGCYERPGGKKPRLRKAKDVAKDVAEALTAFANADGGTLLVGVDDDGSVSGADFPQDRVSLILDSPKNLIVPAPKVETHERDHLGKKLLIFTVNWTPDVYRLTGGRYLLRIGDSNMPFPADQIGLLKSGKRKAFFEARIDPEAGLENLDMALISEFEKRTGLTQNPEETLYRYRLIDYENGKPRLKLATLLLFGKDPLRWHPRCGIDFVKYEGTERKLGAELNIIKRARLELPLVELVEKTYETIFAHIKERQHLHDLLFVEKLEYPTFAWQEAIMNAIAHRDYSIQGLSIEVWMFDDRIEIRSPGLPPEPVTLEKILKKERVHASRNPLIVRMLTDLDYMRETGEGIPRIFEEMEQNGLYPPVFEIVAGSLFSVTLKNQPIYSPEDMEWLKQFPELDLKPNQKRMLLFARAHGGSFTSRDYQKICNVGVYLASQEIKEMIRKGIVKLPRKRGRVYEVLVPGEKKIPEIPDEYRLLEPILEEKGFVKNMDIQQLLSVPRHKAKRIAQRLVTSGFLKKEGEGKGTKYMKNE